MKNRNKILDFVYTELVQEKNMELIVATDLNYGIGLNGKLPWHCPRDLAWFKEKTKGRTLLMGRKTCERLPRLPGRDIICLSRLGHRLDTSTLKNQVQVVSSLDDVIGRVIIAGGAEIYKQALERPGYVQKVYLSIIQRESQVDTHFLLAWLRDFIIVDKTCHDEVHFYELAYVGESGGGERQYLDLVQKVLTHGIPREGRNGLTYSIFGEHMKFDLRQGFPLLTTKKMFMRGILEEFLFFLRGDTDSSILSERKVRIWEGNTSTEFLSAKGLPYAKGVMGPLYGWQWRRFNAPYTLDQTGRPHTEYQPGLDQLAKVVRDIHNDPTSRRILMTTFNPAQVDSGVLYPCHSLITQFYVDGSELDMFCYNRSQDTFLGTPYNIASSALLLMIIAQLTGKTPRILTISCGDVHLYEEHLDVARQQLERLPYRFPQLRIPCISSIHQIPDMTSSDFVLQEYVHHRVLKAPMVA
jgi:dihydrofolate reductase/thymidylate synthase